MNRNVHLSRRELGRSAPLLPCGQGWETQEAAELAALEAGREAHECLNRACLKWHLRDKPGTLRLARLSPDAPVRPRRIKPVSAKRIAQNRERRAMVASTFPERPLCVIYTLSQNNPGLIPDKVLGRCERWADDVHEPLTRARGGSIADPGNAVTPCRRCHDVLTFRPESELRWAYELGLLRHSWEGGAAS